MQKTIQGRTSPQPTDEATVPASHFEHAKDPAGAYLPGPQSVQMEAALAPTAAESLPATHSVQTVAALASEYLQAPQSVQTVAPEMGEYFPAPHGVQVPFTGPAFPASQFEY